MLNMISLLSSKTVKKVLFFTQSSEKCTFFHSFCELEFHVLRLMKKCGTSQTELQKQYLWFNA